MKLKAILFLSLFSLVFALGNSLASTTIDESKSAEEVVVRGEPMMQLEADNMRFVDELPAECVDETGDDEQCPVLANCKCDCGKTKGIPVTVNQHGEECKDVNGRWCYDTVDKVYSNYTNCK